MRFCIIYNVSNNYIDTTSYGSNYFSLASGWPQQQSYIPILPILNIDAYQLE
jgi:hypothetical protein